MNRTGDSVIVMPSAIHYTRMQLDYILSSPITWISNVVVTFSLNTILSPIHLAYIAPGIAINPRRFAAGTGRGRDAVVLIFSSGRVVCAGANSVDVAKHMALDITIMLLRLGIFVNYTEFRLQNIVCYANSGFYVDLFRIHDACQTDSDYVPDRFPGLTFRFRNSPITIIVFPAGSCIITGARDICDTKAHFAWFYHEAHTKLYT